MLLEILGSSQGFYLYLFLKNYDELTAVAIQGYNIYRRDSNAYGGGVAVYSAFGKYSDPLTFSIFCYITALSLLWYDATSLTHLYFGNFSHSLQILSSSVWLDRVHHCTAIFRSLQRWVQVRPLAGPLKDIETGPEATPAWSWLCA